MMHMPPDNVRGAIHARNPLAVSASKEELSTIQSLDGWSDRALPILGRVASIGLLVTASFFGVGAIIGAGALLLAAETGRAYLHNKADENRELALYHQDIARVLGKPENAKLTVQDMRDAADEKKVGDKALKPLKAELDHLAYRSKFNYAMGAVRALVTTAITGLLSEAMAGFAEAGFTALRKSAMSIFWTVSGSLGLSSMANAAVEGIGWDRFDKTKPPSIYTDLVKIQEVAKNGNVNAGMIFSVALKQDKALAAEIEQKNGMPFENLTARNKMRVVAQYENRVHAALIAEHINEGANVTILPLSMAGQFDLNSLPPLPEKTSESTEPTVARKLAPKQKEKDGFVAKVLDSRRQAEISAAEGAQLG